MYPINLANLKETKETKKIANYTNKERRPPQLGIEARTFLL